MALLPARLSARQAINRVLEISAVRAKICVKERTLLVIFRQQEGRVCSKRALVLVEIDIVVYLMLVDVREYYCSF